MTLPTLAPDPPARDETPRVGQTPFRLFLWLTLWCGLATSPIPAATVPWLGDNPEFDANWSTDANWYGGVAPSPGDSLVFGFSKQNNNNDFPANTPFGSITFTNDGWNLTGNAINLTNGGVAVLWNQPDVPTSPNLLNLPVTFTSPAVISNATPPGTLILAGQISNGGNLLTVGTATGSAVFLDGQVTGAGALRKTGGGLLQLSSGANDYAGDTFIASGTLQLAANSALPSGSGAGDVVVNGTLDLSGMTTFINGISGSGLITNSSSNLAHLNLCTRSVSATFTFDGYIQGALNLSKFQASPTLVLTRQNAYTGDTTVRSGVLRLGTDNALPPTTTLTVGFSANTATFDLGGYSQQVAGLSKGTTGIAIITNSGATDSTLTFSNPASPSAYVGRIVDGAVAKVNVTVAGGTLTLNQINSTYSGLTLVTNNSSTLAVSTAQQGGGPFLVADGANLGVTVSKTNGTLNMALLTLGNTAAHVGNLGIDLGSFGNPTNAPITATSLSATGTVMVNITGSRLQLGQFPLIKHTAAITSATFSSLVLGSLPPGITAHLVRNTSTPSVDLNITAYAGALFWRGETNGLAATNWDATSLTTNWTGAASGLPVGFTNGVPTGPLVFFDDSASNNVVNVTGLVKPFSVTASNSILNYTIGGPGSIVGTSSLDLEGTATVTLATSNTYSGGTLINAGTLKLGASGAIPGGSGKGNVTVNGTLDVAGLTASINGLSGTGVVDNSTGSGTLTVGGNDQTSTFGGVIQNSGGSLSLTKLGAGTLTLSGTNMYSGKTVAQAGTLAITTSGQPSGLLAVSNGATLAVTVSSAGNTLNTASFVLGTGADVTTNSFNFGVFGSPKNPIINATNLTIHGTNIINIAGSGFTVGTFPLIRYSGAIGGSGYSFTLGTVPQGFAAYLSNAPATVQLVITDPGTFVWFGTVNSNWDVGTTLNWHLNGAPITYADGDTVLFDGRGALANQVSLTTDVAPGDVTVRNPTNDYTFNGPGQLTGPANLTKWGTGTLTLNTVDRLTGSTFVNAGQLKLGVNGAIANSASIVVASNALLDVTAPSGGLTVGANSSLSGYGVITGAVTVAQGGSVGPGTAPGTLTFRNNLNLQGSAVMQTWKSGATLNSTKLAVNGLLTYGPASALTVVHTGDPLTGGEVFNLFAAGTFNGAFYSWNLPLLGPGLNWSMNRLTTDGTLAVNRAPVAPNLAAQTTPGIPLYINVAGLLGLCSDADNDALALAAVGSPANGTAALSADGTTLVYMSGTSYIGLDQFTYTISDGRGGSVTGTNFVQVQSANNSSYNRFSLPVMSGGKVSMSLAGFPGDTYTIQRSTNLVDWVNILTSVVPTNGLLQFLDPTSPPLPHAFYRAIFEVGTGESLAAQIIQATGVKGGFVAHIGCGNGELTAALQRNASYMVQGLDQNPANVAATRQYIQSLGIYGSVSADTWDGAHLPYIDNFVNLAVVQDTGTMTTNEIFRVLASLGVAYIQQGASWTKIIKPRPAAISDWTHYAYDASGSCVAPDTVVGPPKRYQWLAGPRFNRHHDVMSSFNAGVSANGRLFHVMDEGSRESVLLPGHWSLIARDGFNGTLLWKRAISSWHPSMYGLKSGPTQLTRRLVAVGDVVYVTLDYYGPVVALDAATGATIQTYNQTAAAQEIYWSQGTLFVVVDPNPKQWSIWESYYDTQKCMNTPATNWNDHPRIIAALNATTGQLLWTNTTVVYPTSIAVDTNGLVFHDGTYIKKLDRNTGALLWTSSTPVPVLHPTYTANGLSMIVYEDTVLMAGGPGTNAPSQNQDGFIWSVDSNNGQVLAHWQHGKNSHLHSPNDLFLLNGLVWSTAAGSSDPVCTGYDRRTGAIVTTIDPGIHIDWIHERCYRSKATVNYFLTSRACLEVINTQTNWGLANDWVRAACLYGFIPANGFIYTTPNDCSCQFEAKLTGLGALAPASADTNYPVTQPDSVRLQPGPAYAQAVAVNAAPSDWPMYRHDYMRSGYTTNAVPAALSLGWQTALGGKLSSVTVAEGKLFVASVDTHTIFALGATTGTNVWSYTVGGRVDSPPTIYNGRVLFGSADGYVYCLRATDGALIWRFLAAPTDLRHMSYEQLESVWPVSGSVLVLNDKVYCVAGRSMYLDGGCRFLALNPTNGVKLIEQVMDDKVPGTKNSLTSLEKTFNGPVALADLLSSDGQRIFMKSQWFDLDGMRTNIGPMTSNGAVNVSWVNQVGEGVHLFTPTGFLDDSWMHRSYWVWGKVWASGAGAYFLAGKNAPCGQILSIDELNVYGFGRQPQYYKWTLPKENMLFSTSNQNNFYLANPYNWTNTLPFFVKAMAATQNTLVLAGPPDLEDEQQSFSTLDNSQTQVVLANQDGALNGNLGGQLRVVDKATGNTLAMYNVNFVPVWDGMAVAGQSLYLATRDGRVLCLR